MRLKREEQIKAGFISQQFDVDCPQAHKLNTTFLYASRDLCSKTQSGVAE